MKKSQILAALALAFALGVVAPVSSTYAKVGGDSATAAVITTDVQTAIDAAKALDGYEDYCHNEAQVTKKGLVALVASVDTHVDTALATALSTLQTSLGSYTTAGANTAETALSFNPTTYTTYASLKSAVENEIARFASEQKDDVAKNALIQTDIDRLEYALSQAAAPLATAYNTEVATYLLPKLLAMGLVQSGQITPSGAGAQYTATDFDAVRAIAVAAPFETYASLCEAVKVAEDVVNPAGKTYEQGAARSAGNNVMALVNAIKNGTSTPSLEPVTPGVDEPETPADPSAPKPGNTGVIAGADATAKATVSIMAAIASVATAAFVAIRKIAAGKKA